MSHFIFHIHLKYFMKGFLFPGTGNSILLNGIGMNNQTMLHVQPNKVYRIRLLNAAALAYFNFAIANHNLTVIQFGSTPTQQVVMNSVDLSSGQRVDVLISTHSKPIASYKLSVQTEWRGNDFGISGKVDVRANSNPNPYPNQWYFR